MIRPLLLAALAFTIALPAIPAAAEDDLVRQLVNACVGCRFPKDLRGRDLHGLRFVGADLSGVDFSRADLKGASFTGSDLEVLLRSRRVNRLVLTGIATSGVVLSTLREAADRDYELTVLADACADADDEVHRILIEKVFPRQALVMTVEEWAMALKGG